MKFKFKQNGLDTNSELNLIADKLIPDINKVKYVDDLGNIVFNYETNNIPENSIDTLELKTLLNSDDSDFEGVDIRMEVDKSILENDVPYIFEDNKDIIKDENGKILISKVLKYKEYFQYIEGKTNVILRLSNQRKNPNGGILSFGSKESLKRLLAGVQGKIILNKNQLSEKLQTKEYILKIK